MNASAAPDGGALVEWSAAPMSPDRPPEQNLHSLPIGLEIGDRGRARMSHMHELPRSRRRAPNGRLCMLAGPRNAHGSQRRHPQVPAVIHRRSRPPDATAVQHRSSPTTTLMEERLSRVNARSPLWWASVSIGGRRAVLVCDGRSDSYPRFNCRRTGFRRESRAV